MSKVSKLWVYPLSVFMLLLGVLDIVDDYRFNIVVGDEANKVYDIIYGLIFVVVGIYYLMVIFLEDTRDNEEDTSLKDILSAFLMFAIPSFLLCFIGYLKIFGAMESGGSASLIDYDLYSYAQLIFGILCFFLFFQSYPKLKLRNLLLLLAGLMVVGSGFMQLFAYTDLIFYSSYVIYVLGIVAFGYSCYLNDKHYK